jgi:hypothetical protein
VPCTAACGALAAACYAWRVLYVLFFYCCIAYCTAAVLLSICRGGEHHKVVNKGTSCLLVGERPGVSTLVCIRCIVMLHLLPHCNHLLQGW